MGTKGRRATAVGAPPSAAADPVAAPGEMRIDLTRDDLERLMETEAQRLVGCSAAEAFARIDRGELASTLAADELRGLRWLREEPR